MLGAMQAQIYQGQTLCKLSQNAEGLPLATILFLLSKLQHPKGQILLLLKKKAPCSHLDKL